MTITTTVEASGIHAMAEEDLCRAVGEDLQRVFPNYPWMVGVNVEAGTVVVDLPEVFKPIKFKNWGILLHLGSLMGPGGQKKVIHAGGEMLERLGLPRGVAPKDAKQRAQQNGMDVANAVIKSRGSTI